MTKKKPSGGEKIRQQDDKGVVVLIEPDESVRDALTTLLRGDSWQVTVLKKCDELEPLLDAGEVTAVVSESSLPDCTPDKILGECSKHHVPVIFTGHDLSLQGAVDLIRQGASDFLDKPFPQGRLVDLLNEISQRQFA